MVWLVVSFDAVVPAAFEVDGFVLVEPVVEPDALAALSPVVLVELVELSLFVLVLDALGAEDDVDAEVDVGDVRTGIGVSRLGSGSAVCVLVTTTVPLAAVEVLGAGCAGTGLPRVGVGSAGWVVVTTTGESLLVVALGSR